MAKILVVDDEADLEVLIRQKFRKKIRANEYDFVFAINGLDALAKIKEVPDIDMVLSDINMPEMDGLTLLSKINEQHSILKSVIVSAYGDMDNIRTAMNCGAFDFITKPVDFNDLELTIDKTMKHVNQIKETLQAIKENNILKMYVDETVLNFMDTREFESSMMENETVEATVVFIDLCKFTYISETVPPDIVVELLNQYFDIMVKEIIAEDGIVDKFIGDAIMAVFRGDQHLERALDACLSARSAIENMPDLTKELEYHPDVSIGVNCGEMIFGNIGSSSLKRLDYTVIGNVVNTAQRLQSAAQDGQILITEEAYKKVKESFGCKKVGELTLKNKEEVVTAYEVLS